MLKLINLKKSYNVALKDIEVLKGLSISFRKNEFVSILGPSGCGKTTTLNIIGGLDSYNSGDLVIEGKSTKDYTNRDWDIYRNQSIGFVFQSYNLIPHQTVLSNVELALTISGVAKEEREKRAIAALDRVGITEYYKKPNQLSGGQCQRVAIARALVNEPKILLADEPTGALDSTTSLQIMELIKEISNDKLVIMVTHNKELALEYSNRIVNLVDGQIVSDSNPYNEEEEAKEIKPLEIDHKSKAKMSWWTAFKLSFKNLWSKRKRTIMTAIASSIGIIGISSVLALSNGVRGYIANTEYDMLSGNPITITQSSIDLESLMNGMSPSEKIEFINQEGYANVNTVMKYLIDRYIKSSVLTSNNISQDYIDYLLKMDSNLYSSLMLNYGLNLEHSIYTDYEDGYEDTKNLSISAIKEIYTSILKRNNLGDYASMVTSLEKVFQEAPTDTACINTQYDIVKGKIATEKNELMLVLDSNQAASDLLLAELGYYKQNDYISDVMRYLNTNDSESFLKHINYDELLNKSFTWYPNNSIYTIKDEQITYNPSGKNLENGEELKVVGILKPKPEINYGCLSNGFYYTKELTNYVINTNMGKNSFGAIDDNKTSEIVKFYKDRGVTSYYISYMLNYSYKNPELNITLPVNETVSLKDNVSIVDKYLNPGSSGMVNLNSLGGSDVANQIAIHPINFEAKDKITAYLDNWNNSNFKIYNDGKELTTRDKINYTDTFGVVINIVDSVVNIVTLSLVAFTALSLIVSCVMISIITYISVVERIKEIGIIRSLGGRKKDVSNLFNAETLIIGICSGVFGVIITYIISLVVNISLKSLVGVNIMTLPFTTALFMVILSIILTVLSGFLPALKASKQNPVDALRSE